MNRRHFLNGLSLAATGLLLPVGRSTWAAVNTADAPTQKKLIVIMLRGAVDGLSIVAPYSEAEYYRSRSSIAIPKPGQTDGLIDLDGHFGMHPALAPLQPLWQEKKLAFVHASGSPDTTRSHFDAQDYLESGTPGRKSTQDGWMNRLLQDLPGTATPTRGVSIGPVLPRIYAGTASVANIANGQAATRPTMVDQPRIADAFAQMYAGDDKASRAFQEAKSTRKEVMASLDPNQINGGMSGGMNSEMSKEQIAANNGAPLPNGFPDDAARLALLMRNDPRVQLAFADLGGWDTHANQGAGKGQLANRLQPLSLGLSVMAQRLGPVFDDTTIVVMSEFGRTVRQNGNGGTDHGHGNVMWVLGGKVNGGMVHGDWPGLADRSLYEGRDVAVTTDFRSVLAQIGEQHLRLPDAQLERVFPLMPNQTASLHLIRA